MFVVILSLAASVPPAVVFNSRVTLLPDDITRSVANTNSTRVVATLSLTLAVLLTALGVISTPFSNNFQPYAAGPNVPAVVFEATVKVISFQAIWPPVAVTFVLNKVCVPAAKEVVGNETLANVG